MANLAEMFDLTDQVALVTGGSRGLGRDIAAGLLEMNAKVVITARKKEELKSAEKDLEKISSNVCSIQGDVSSLGAIAELIDTVMDKFGDIDILVNNAGTSWAEPAEEHSVEGWRKVMALNVDGLFFLTQEVARRSMIPRKRGKIINIASIGGMFGNPPAYNAYTSGYCASKGAVVSLTKQLASEWGKHNINVNAVCPGFFETRMAEGYLNTLGPEIMKLAPLQRIGGSDDLKGVIAFFASEASRHVTGQALGVDGGVSAV